MTIRYSASAHLKINASSSIDNRQMRDRASASLRRSHRLRKRSSSKPSRSRNIDKKLEYKIELAITAVEARFGGMDQISTDGGAGHGVAVYVWRNIDTGKYERGRTIIFLEGWQGFPTENGTFYSMSKYSEDPPVKKDNWLGFVKSHEAAALIIGQSNAIQDRSKYYQKYANRLNGPVHVLFKAYNRPNEIYYPE